MIKDIDSYLVEVPRVVAEVRIVDYTPNVALEVPVVHGIEADERHKEPEVGFRESVTTQVP